MRMPVAAGTNATRVAARPAAADGRAAIAPKTTASRRHVVESASQSTLKLLPNIGGTLPASITETARGKAAACANALNARMKDENPSKILGVRGTGRSPRPGRAFSMASLLRPFLGNELEKVKY